MNHRTALRMSLALTKSEQKLRRVAGGSVVNVLAYSKIKGEAQRLPVFRRRASTGESRAHTKPSFDVLLRPQPQAFHVNDLPVNLSKVGNLLVRVTSRRQYCEENKWSCDQGVAWCNRYSS